MTRKDIVEGLVKKGYKAEAYNKISNGVTVEGIVIRNGAPVSPVIYTKRIIESAEQDSRSLEAVINEVIEIYNICRNMPNGIDTNRIFDREFVRAHIYIAVQRKSAEDIMKKDIPLEGLEAYLYVYENEGNNDSFSYKFKRELLEKYFSGAREAWKCAEKNTFSETTIVNMNEIFKGAGMNVEECVLPAYVLSNKRGMRGASAILDKKSLSRFGKEHDTKKIMVLPSSIHEMLIIPYESGMDIDVFSQIVSDINFYQVSPQERLTDKAYVMEI